MTTYMRTVRTALNAEKLLRVDLCVAAAWTFNATDYWTVELRHKRPQDQYGETIAGPYSLATRSLEAGALKKAMLSSPRSPAPARQRRSPTRSSSWTPR